MSARSPRQSLAFAVVTGLASTVPIWRAPRRLKVAVVVGSGVAGGIGGYVALRHPEQFGAARPAATTAQSVALGTVAAGAAAGTATVGFAVDRALEQFLVRRDVRHPRVVLGVVGAVLSYAMDVLDHALDSD